MSKKWHPVKLLLEFSTDRETTNEENMQIIRRILEEYYPPRDIFITVDYFKIYPAMMD